MSLNNPDQLSTFSNYDDVRTPTNLISDLFIYNAQGNVQNKDKLVRVEKSASKQFFNYKKKRFFFLWSIVFIGIIFLVIRFLLNLNFITFFTTLYQISSNSHFAFVIILGFLFFVINDMYLRVKMLKIKLAKRLSHIKFKDWLGYGFVSFFIQSITPFSIGSEPYTIWWLKQRGIGIKSSTAVVAVSSFCWFVGQFLITWPSFIYITTVNWKEISSFTITKTYWGIVLGLVIDIFIGSVIFGISYMKKVHYKIALFINFVRKNMGIRYLEKSQIKKKYLHNNSFQKVYLSHLKDKSTYLMIVLYVLQNLYYYLLFAAIYQLFAVNDSTTGNFLDFFYSYNIINVSTTSNNFLPLPSSEGSLQLVIRSLMSGLKEGVQENDISNAIFLWRFFTKYCGLVLSVVYLVGFGFNVRPKKIKKLHQLTETPLELVF